MVRHIMNETIQIKQPIVPQVMKVLFSPHAPVILSGGATGTVVMGGATPVELGMACGLESMFFFSLRVDFNK